jgi:hypothetical protein
MDIKQIINVNGPKGTAVAAAAATNGAARDLHLLQSISHVNSFPLWESGSERGTSSPGSEPSRYPTPRTCCSEERIYGKLLEPPSYVT